MFPGAAFDFLGQTMKINVDRRLPISVADQIKGQISYAIACGVLNRGEQLPSVRELATTLQVAPVTISQVYRELARTSLIVARPGVGTFVADITCTVDGERLDSPRENLRLVVDNCLRQARSLGYSVDDIQSMFVNQAKQYRAPRPARQIVMVGNFGPATESYARELENILHDLDVRVLPIVLDDLVRLVGLRKTIESAQLVITIPTRLAEVRRLLNSQRTRVIAVAFRPSLETRRKIAAIPPNRRVGLVATYREFLQTLVDEVASYSMTKAPAPCLVLDQETGIRDLLARIDVLIYASGSEKVLEWLPDGVEAFEFRHAPEPDSVNRLRPLFDQAFVRTENEQ